MPKKPASTSREAAACKLARLRPQRFLIRGQFEIQRCPLSMIAATMCGRVGQDKRAVLGYQKGWEELQCPRIAGDSN
jgi:hypothetical protein